MSAHLDLDALADVLAGELEPAHLAGCAGCQARLEELAAALPGVTRALAEAPVPEVPSDLPDRLIRALAGERTLAVRGVDVLPMRRRRTRWLPALGAVAAAAAMVTGGVLLLQDDGTERQADTASSGGYAVNDSGTNYTRTGTELQSQLSALLTGSAEAKTFSAATPNDRALRLSGGTSAQKSTQPVPEAAAAAPPRAADPLAALRTTLGLATCLNSLTPPDQSGVPLALDYATFEGKPALVVVLPASSPDKVDVFVVPPGCAKADGNVYYFRRLPKP